MFDRHVGSLRINSVGEVGMILDVHVHLVSMQFAGKGKESAKMYSPHSSARPGFEGGRRSRNCTNETDVS